MKIEFKLFEGQHCETNAIGNQLSQLGVTISEPMLFGLGEGLSFVFLNLSSLNLPFIGGRTRPFEITERLCANLGFKLFQQETSSKKNALVSVQSLLSENKCVGLQLDSFYLDYFTTKVHFAGHFVAAIGFDENHFYIVDTKQQGTLHKCTYESLEQARFAKGVMAAKARYWTIDFKAKHFDLRKAIPRAIKNNAMTYLNPQFKGASFHGIEKLSASLPKWITIAKKPKEDLALSALMMERAGTGGSIFRNFYREFLIESSELLQNQKLQKAAASFGVISEHWRNVSFHLQEASNTLDQKHLIRASDLCKSIAKYEFEVMSLLASI